MIQTKHFNPNTDIKLLCTCGHPNCDKRSVNQSVLDKVELLRVMVDRPLTVTSGGRCKNHPNEIMRTTTADHQKGIGIDIAVSGGVQRGELVEVGIQCGFNAIGVAKTFVHLGRREGEELVMWVY